MAVDRKQKLSIIAFYTTLSYLSIFTAMIWYNFKEDDKGEDTMRPLKEKISITIDNDILEQIKIQAERDDRSLSQYINVVLKEHLKKKE